MQSNGQHAIQDNLRSPLSVLIERPYVTSCVWVILTYILSHSVSVISWIIGRSLYAVACHLSVVCNVRAPYSGDWNFWIFSTAFSTLAILWQPGKILRRLFQGNPSVSGMVVKCKRGSQI